MVRQLLIYAGGLAVVGLLVAAKMALFPELGRESPFLLFLGATIVAASLGGFGPGLVTTVASGLAVDYVFLAPHYELLTGPNTWQTVLFLLEGAFISWVVESLRRANHRARRAVTVRDDLMAVLAHDLRNLVAVVIGSAPMVKELAPPGVLEESGADLLLDGVARSGEAMRVLINDLLDTAKIEATGLSVELVDTDVRGVVEEVVQLLTPVAKGRRLSVSADGEPGSWHAEVDPLRLRQALSNLGTNALKFTPEGGTVLYRITGAGESLRVSVADTGRGIDPDDLPHLFDRFWQANRPGRAAGAGLGLFIVKGIVDAHRGRVDVDSTPGKGTTFTLTLPRRRRAPAHRTRLGWPAAAGRLRSPS